MTDHDKDYLVMENRGFVYDMAKNYASSGVPFNDLVNAGMLGLTIASKKYDENKEVKFISFATSWVQHEMIKVIRETRFPCRIPLNLNKTINQARRGDIDEEDPLLADVLPLLRTPETHSYTDYIFFGEEVINRVSVAQALAYLEPRAREMIKMLFGIGEYEQSNVPAIAAHFKLSKQRVRNLIKQGMVQIKKILKGAV